MLQGGQRRKKGKGLVGKCIEFAFRPPYFLPRSKPEEISEQSIMQGEGEEENCKLSSFQKMLQISSWGGSFSHRKNWSSSATMFPTNWFPISSSITCAAARREKNISMDALQVAFSTFVFFCCCLPRPSFAPAEGRQEVRGRIIVMDCHLWA